MEATQAKDGRLYDVRFDNEMYFIEARSLPEAVQIWKAHVEALWGDNYEGDEEPESIALIHDEGVIRMKGE